MNSKTKPCSHVPELPLIPFVAPRYHPSLRTGRTGSLPGLESHGLTDINSVTGIYEFQKQSTAAGIKPVGSIEFRSGNEFRYIGLAKNAGEIAQ